MSLLGDLPRLARVTVRCTTCKRFGSYQVGHLLDCYGPDITDLDLLRTLTQSCGHQHETYSGKRRRYASGCLATIGLPERPAPELPVPPGMPYSIDTWAQDGDTFELHLGLLHSQEMARAAFAVACTLWPDTPITIRQGMRVLQKQEPASRPVERQRDPGEHEAMCNLYSLGRPQAEIRAVFGAERDETGNLPPLTGIFPDQMAPVVLGGAGGRTLTMMRWGIPGPKAFGEHPVTNVRNVASPHWRPWLKPEYRCLVPVTSFSEYAGTKPKKTPVWFALADDRPLFAFAGIWRPWTGVRGTKAENPDRAEAEHRLFSFLTCPPNGVVGPVHPKAMPVLLTKPEEWATWLEAPTAEALKLQRPLPDGAMCEVARGERRDELPDA